MMKPYVFLLTLLSISVCMADVNHYYKQNPLALQKAMRACPDTQPRGVSCDQLKIIAEQINQSAQELRMDPQGYGQRILALQALVVKQSSEVKKGEAHSELQTSLKKNTQQLQERLAIVKWLESPES